MASDQQNPLHDNERAPTITAIGGGWFRNRKRGKRTIYANALTHETSARWPSSIERPPGEEWESSADENAEDGNDHSDERNDERSDSGKKQRKSKWEAKFDGGGVRFSLPVPAEQQGQEDDTSRRSLYDGGPPDEWVEHKDRKSGETYYFNKSTGATSWEKPEDKEMLWARARFVEAAEGNSQSNVETEEDEPTLNREQFKKLCRELFGDEGIPSEGDLNRAFMTADADNSGDIDEGEFLELFTMVRDGKVHGLAVEAHFGHDNFSGGKKHMSRSSLSLKRRIKARPRLIHAKAPTVYKGLTFEPLSVTGHALATPHPRQGRKLQQLDMHEGSLTSFLHNTFRYTGTVLQSLRGPLIMTFIMVASANYVRIQVPYNVPHDALNFYPLFSKILAFFLAFRLNEAVITFNEGRQNIENTLNALREMVCHAYCCTASGDVQHNIHFEHSRREIVRLVNLLFALMRQALRESVEGFSPGSSLEGKTFVDNWHMDTVEPRITSLMTKEEYSLLKNIPPHTRPTWVQTKIYVLANKLSGYQELPGSFLQNFVKKHMQVMEAFESSMRIMETPLPTPYRHLIGLMSFLFVFLYPWMLASKHDATGHVRVGHANGSSDLMIGWIESLLVSRRLSLRT